MPATLRSALQTTLSALRRPRSTDADLLAAFAATRDESAFAELVRRHGGLVLGTSLRAVGDRGTAEDVFQATFLLLARKAASVSWGPTVGPWLYQAVRRLSAKARAGAARRAVSPLPPDVPAPATDPAANLARAEIRDALDEALAALPAHLREPLVLCYLEGLTQDEAAAALRCPPATIKGRVTRGRERLRKLLERRGLSLSVALSGLLVSEASVSAGAAAITARAATVFATTGAASPKVLALLGGTPAGLKLVAGLVGLILACTAVAGLVGGSPGPKEVAKGAVRAAPPVVRAEPVPAGAVARLGTRWLCGPSRPGWVVFSPDGKRVASMGYGLAIWDASTGRPLLERTNYRVRSRPGWRADGTGIAVVMLRDGSHFITPFTDPDAKLPLPPVPKNPPRPDGPETFALSPDGTRLAVVRNPTGERFTIDLLLATPGRPVSALKRERTLGPFDGPFSELRYTADGSLMFLIARGDVIGERFLLLVDIAGNKVRRTASIPAPGMLGMQHGFSLSDDGRLAAVLPPSDPKTRRSRDDTLCVYDTAARKELRSLPSAEGGYGWGCAFTPDGKNLITSTNEAFFQVWNLATGKESVRSPVRGGGSLGQGAWVVGVSPDGKRFATARIDGRVDLWHTATGKPVIPLDTHRDAIDGAAVSPDGRLGATLSYDGTVRVWDMAGGKTGCVIPAPLESNPSKYLRDKRRLTFAPDGRGLLFPSDGKLAMANPTTGKRLELPRGLRASSGKLGGFSADGKTLMTFGGDKVELWDWPAGTVRLTITVPVPETVVGRKRKPDGVIVKSASLSPDGRFVFTNSAGLLDPAGEYYRHSTNDLWDARTGKRLHQMMNPRVEFPTAAFSPDGKVVYLGGHAQDIPADRRTLADALTAWDTATGRLLRRFDSPAPAVADDHRLGRQVDPIAVSPDGRLLAAGMGHYAPDAIVRLYETSSGKVIGKLTGHANPVSGLVFSPDGSRLLSVSGDQTGLVWDVAEAIRRGERP